MRNFVIFIFVTIIIFSLYECSTTKRSDMQKSLPNEIKAIKLQDFDTSISPSEDFYQYATGGWQKNNPLPDEESRYGTFDQLAKETNIKINDLITSLDPSMFEKISIEWKIAMFYKMGMDTTKIEKQGIIPIMNYLTRIDNLKSKDDLLDIIADFHRLGIPVGFNIFGSADPMNSNNQIAFLYQGGLGLPNRDYYVNDDKRSKEIREAYCKHINRLFELVGIENSNYDKKILEFETELAQNSYTNLELRDPYKNTNRFNLEELKRLFVDFDIEKYFLKLGIENHHEIVNVSQPEFFKKFNEIYNNKSYVMAVLLQ